MNHQGTKTPRPRSRQDDRRESVNFIHHEDTKSTKKEKSTLPASPAFIPLRVVRVFVVNFLYEPQKTPLGILVSWWLLSLSDRTGIIPR
jgi:hypothetical protein